LRTCEESVKGAQRGCGEGVVVGETCYGRTAFRR
jgi:hypothetical protein